MGGANQKASKNFLVPTRRGPDPHLHYPFSKFISQPGGPYVGPHVVSQFCDGPIKNEWKRINSKPVYQRYPCKILLVGLIGTGRSSLSLQFVQNCFVEDYDPYESFRKQIQIDGEIMIVELIEGNDEHSGFNIFDQDVRAAGGLLLIFSILDRDSFDYVQKTIRKIVTIRDVDDEEELCVSLVGTKCDEANKRTVSYEEANALAKKHSWKYFEVSAKENIGVTEMFHSIVVEATFETKESFFAREFHRKVRCEMPLVSPERVESLKQLTKDRGIQIGPFPPSTWVPLTPPPTLPKIIPVPVLASEFQAFTTQVTQANPNFPKKDYVILVGVGRLYLSLHQQRSKLNFVLPLDTLKQIASFLEPKDRANFFHLNKYLLFHLGAEDYAWLDLPSGDFELFTPDPKAMKNLLKVLNASYVEVDSLTGLLDLIFGAFHARRLYLK